LAHLLSILTSAVPWPFPARPSLENLADPEARQAVAIALLQLGLAALLLAIAAVIRRGRIVPVLVALTLIVLQAPSLELLLVDAYPTSYRTSPAGFTAASIAMGQDIFATSCVACHGKAGDGAGGSGDVADLRQPHVWTHPVGDLFWFVSHGITSPDGSPLMPAFDTKLAAPARWAVIDYVYALNAGAVTRGLEDWPRRLLAPNVPLSCGSLSRDLSGLRGKAIRLILGDLTGPVEPLSPVRGIAVVTVWMPGDTAEAGAVPGVDCVALGGAKAYAILAGSADGRMTQARFLIDPEGVLRSVWRMDDGDDPARLLEEVRTICTEPLTIETGDAHEHHH
jgi:mono/diheme cytochrome c family protein